MLVAMLVMAFRARIFQYWPLGHFREFHENDSSACGTKGTVARGQNLTVADVYAVNGCHCNTGSVRVEVHGVIKAVH